MDRNLPIGPLSVMLIGLLLLAVAPPALAELLRSNGFILALPLGLQADAAYLPKGGALSADKVALGNLLYFDTRFSLDQTLSCASCHNPYHGFADPARTSQGVKGRLGRRNSPTLINRLFSKEQFWDGRATDLEAQAQGPIFNPVEMAMPSHAALVTRLIGVTGYRPLFAKAFGSEEITVERITQAIAAYERTVVSGNSPYDRFIAGETGALSAAAVRGMGLFEGKGNCKECHSGFNFTDEAYHNLGVGWDAEQQAFRDLGRFEVTKAEVNKGAFKTPTLRNVGQTAPYMHDGSEATLQHVIAFYNRGGNPNPGLSQEIAPLHLTPQEMDDLVAFLHALTGEVYNAEPPAHFPQ